MFQMLEPAVSLAGVLISSPTLNDQFGGEQKQRVQTRGGRSLAELVSSAAELKAALFQIFPSRNNEKKKKNRNVEVSVRVCSERSCVNITQSLLPFNFHSFLENASRAVKDLCERGGF